MLVQKNSIIMRLDFLSDQTVGHVKKYVGLTKAKHLVSVIDNLNLGANPRSSKTGPVTDAIQDSVEHDSLLFPFKTKGILLACSQYALLERGRIRIIPSNPMIEGILDGGHNTLAIGLYILGRALNYSGMSLPRGAKTWDQFKSLWTEYRDSVDLYLDALKMTWRTTALISMSPLSCSCPATLQT